jgi:hypothetical protein
MRLWKGVLLRRDCSDSFPPAGSVAACPALVARVSMSCPCLPVPAVGVLLRERLVRAAAREAPVVVAAAAVGCPIGHSDRLHAHPFAVPVPVVCPTTMRTVRELAEGPLGRQEAMAGMVCLFLCSMREELVKCANRLPCPRLFRRRGAAAEGCCIVMWYS